jgi:hypothetical protein
MQAPKAGRVRRLGDRPPDSVELAGPMKMTSEDNPGAEYLLFFRDAAIET